MYEHDKCMSLRCLTPDLSQMPQEKGVQSMKGSDRANPDMARRRARLSRQMACLVRHRPTKKDYGSCFEEDRYLESRPVWEDELVSDLTLAGGRGSAMRHLRMGLQESGLDPNA